MPIFLWGECRDFVVVVLPIFYLYLYALFMQQQYKPFVIKVLQFLKTSMLVCEFHVS